MAQINPYLNFNGNTEEVFNFYKSCFGGDFATVVRFKDMPSEQKMSEEDGNKIMHIALPIGANTLMGTDILESFGHTLKVGDNIYVSVHTDSNEEADKLYGALSKGGKIEMPIGVAPWGDYFGMFWDKYGIKWLVDHPAQRA